MAYSQRINGWLRKIPAWPLYFLLPIPGIYTFVLALLNQLGPDPLYELIRTFGERGLQLIILTLLISPIRRWTGVSLLKFRRAIGLVSFYYICSHMLVWIAIDQGWNINTIIEEIIKRPFITVGMFGFLTMVPLAITSNNYSIRRLGALVWNKIHRLVYLAGAAGVIHYLLVVKAWPMEPIVYTLIVALLLAIRLWWKINKKKKKPA
ncbi:MAG: protein-methionine-sulfoxide reductase heme-binding subunit MsrQ [Paracoccaceae bacterium]|nr:protein-methionine-sulfoxide reductase heme-binding subunit MsrQ [Paracoccaceae bacterium]MDE2675468.1 protein-methionine-sulfoxide reductase heme-binding subunit MsrQ [Paracoccaceae bacterium]MXZ49221.1 protein-methionine-sulfoxide reductase heme-binding subunit MsrQ [Paracoccaceae bacterium]MYF45823.1 protein-methionine-sulfoxide reductase heme-binding subunit MsrQ [Paracoccaceae bacterium]MYI92192.1 protein-methionine-sulfoxide reductase heme-binding subunit MsrQ [Paracoccaceae bacterium]